MGTEDLPGCRIPENCGADARTVKVRKVSNCSAFHLLGGIAQVNTHIHLHISQAQREKLPGDGTDTGRIRGQRKHLFIPADRPRQVLLPAMDTDQRHVFPGHMQPGRQVNHTGNATDGPHLIFCQAFFLFDQTEQLFRPAVKAHIPGKSNHHMLILWMLQQERADFLTAGEGYLRTAKGFHAL